MEKINEEIEHALLELAVKPLIEDLKQLILTVT